MKEINMLKSDTLGTRGTLPFAKAGAWDARADRAREVQDDAERER